jgi:hypothetical protein
MEVALDTRSCSCSRTLRITLQETAAVPLPDVAVQRYHRKTMIWWLGTGAEL